MRIVMIGTGYVGLVTGTCFAEIGHNVTCIDVDSEKIKSLSDGVSPIFEPGLEPMMRNNLEQNRLKFSTDLGAALEGAECAFIAVGTPEGEDGSADLKYVYKVATDIGRLASNSLMVVTKSTVPVGSGDRVEEMIHKELEDRSVNHKISVTSNPEFLKEGDALSDFMRPDRIIVGVCSEDDTQMFREIYRPFVLDDPSKLLSMDRRSSELTKYGANAMLATRISFMNELSILCEKLGADVDHVRRGMGSDPRIGRKFLYAGPGYGGSCFPKDVQALMNTGSQNGVEFSVLKAVTDVNNKQKLRVAEKVQRYFGDLKGRKIAVWGLAFKPGTDDVREAPAKTIIESLISWGARVSAHDPEALETFKRSLGDQPLVSYFEDAYDALDGADALVLITEWSEYRRPNWNIIEEKLKSKVIFDLRNQFDPASVMESGFHYQCVGRPDSRWVESRTND